MRPGVIGVGLAAVMAGPPLYSMVQSGGLDGSSAVLRGLLLAAICTVGVTYVLQIVARYDREWERRNRAKREQLKIAIAEAEAAQLRKNQADEFAAQAQQKAGRKSS